VIVHPASRLEDQIAGCAAILDPESLLALRVEGLVLNEHATSVSGREQGSERIGGRG